jgi:hypothetical protein
MRWLNEVSAVNESLKDRLRILEEVKRQEAEVYRESRQRTLEAGRSILRCAGLLQEGSWAEAVLAPIERAITGKGEEGELPTGCMQAEDVVGLYRALAPAEQTRFWTLVRAPQGGAPEQPSGWLTVPQAANLLGVNRSTIKRRADAGKLPDNGKPHRARRVLASTIGLQLLRRACEHYRRACQEADRHEAPQSELELLEVEAALEAAIADAKALDARERACLSQAQQRGQ